MVGDSTVLPNFLFIFDPIDPPFPLILNFFTPHFYKSLDLIGSILFCVLYPGTENFMKYPTTPPPRVGKTCSVKGQLDCVEV